MTNAYLIHEARKQANELASDGINGTPNLLIYLADALESAQLDSARLDWLLASSVGYPVLSAQASPRITREWIDAASGKGIKP